jgi:transposase-like protein
VRARMDFPTPHQAKLRSTDALERLNKDVKRRADVVGTSPNESAIIRPNRSGAAGGQCRVQLQNRYMQTDVMAEPTPPLINAVPPRISTVAA